MVRYLRSLTILGLVFLMLLFSNDLVVAQECEQINCNSGSDEYEGCLINKQSCWQGKIEEAQREASTLKSAINIFNGQIKVLQLQIDGNIFEISKLEKEIVELGDRIEGLNYSLDKLSNVMVERVAEDYKRGYNSPLISFLGKNNFSSMVSEHKYLTLAKQQTVAALAKAEGLRLNYDEQKQIKEKKQTELEEKKRQLVVKKTALDEQKQSKQNLLQVTNNNEKTYQTLLAQAKAEVAALKTFSVAKGGGVLPAQNSPDGWYFSQRDERWAGLKIGNSNMTMMEVGCLVSSVAMIRKKFGEGVTPITIATNNSFFFANTANMLLSNPSWSAPSGYRYNHVAFSASKLDEELQKNPVIAKLGVGPYGTHFIVIKEKKDGNYIMHDPWEGYDKKFSDYYSLSNIWRISYLSQ